jgi:Mor family transcriptional regulator
MMADIKAFDVLSFVLHEVMRQHPSYTEVQARQLLPKLHEALGGDSYYVAKTAPSLQEEKREALLRDAASSASPRELQARHGVSRATLYRLRKIKPPP